MRIVVLALACFVLLSNAYAFSDDEIRDLYSRALAGDKTATQKCIDALDEILRRDPSNQLARVYLGSSYTLRSRDLGYGMEKLHALKEGIALMDEAVRAAPTNDRVRLVSALTSDGLPFFAGRRKLAADEFLDLAKSVPHRMTNLSATDWQLLFLNAGRVGKERGDRAQAAEFWRLGLTKHANPKLTAQLQDALDAL